MNTTEQISSNELIEKMPYYLKISCHAEIPLINKPRGMGFIVGKCLYRGSAA
jgi:hypothetical protein